MNRQYYLTIVGCAALGIILATSAFILSERQSQSLPAVETSPKSIVVSFTIEGLYDKKEIATDGNATVLEMLTALNADDPELNLVTKDYGSMGTLIEAMNGLYNGTDGKYWQYTVNGVMPPVGVHALTLSEGDSVEWKFTNSSL